MSNELQVQNDTPITLLKQAIDKNMSPDQLREFMALEREWRADKAKSAFNEAMAKFGGLKKNIAYNRTGTTAGSVKFGYSDFPTVVGAVTPWLEQCGLSFSHSQVPPVMGEAGVSWVSVTCTVKHRDGHAESNSFPAMPDTRLTGKVSPSQLLQMAITYAKRQTLAMALGLATEEDRHDDDDAPTVERITEAQVADLTALLDEITDREKAKQAALKYAKVTELHEIPADKFKSVVAGLEKRRNAS